MRILLTNDDGIESPGLKAISTALEKRHEVWIVAPDTERSATSHYITIRRPIVLRETGDRRYSADGSPADCVIVGMLGALPEEPDLVVSGINIGPNLGTDIIYSGTVAAARQGAIMGKPSYALSLDTYTKPFYFEALVEFFVDNLPKLLELWKDDHFVNINAPNVADPPGRMEVTRPAWRTYHDKLAEFQSPAGEIYYFLGGSPVETELDSGTDWYAVSKGSISVSPISINPARIEEDDRYQAGHFVVSKV